MNCSLMHHNEKTTSSSFFQFEKRMVCLHLKCEETFQSKPCYTFILIRTIFIQKTTYRKKYVTILLFNGLNKQSFMVYFCSLFVILRVSRYADYTYITSLLVNFNEQGLQHYDCTDTDAIHTRYAFVRSK